jgi:hypothetical protein
LGHKFIKKRDCVEDHDAMEDNIKENLRIVGCEEMQWIVVAKDRAHF